MVMGLLVAALLAVTVLPCASAVVEYGLGLVSETIQGRNSTGPYFLAYTNIQERSLEITLNGSMLRSGKDYRVDLAKGVLTFDRILISNAVAKATYKITSGKSVKTAGVLKVPLEMELLDNGSNKIRLIGGYTQTATANQNAGTVIGLGSENKIGSASVSTMLLTGKPVEGAPDPGNTGWNDKSLYKVAASTTSGGLTVTSNVLRVGKSFINPMQYGVSAGRESDDVNMTYKYGKLVDFSAVYQKLNETLANTEHIINQQNLTVRPGDNTVVALVHGQNVSNKAGSEKTVETTGVKIEQKIGQGANAAVSREEVITSTGGNTENVTTTQVSASGGNQVVQVTGSAVQKEFGNKEDETSVTLNANAKPAANIGVNMGYNQAQNAQVGNQTSTNVQVNAVGNGNVNIQAGHSETDSTKLGQTSQTNIGVTTQNVGVGVGLANSKNGTVGEQTVTNVNLAVKEGNLLQVNAGASQTNSTKLGGSIEHNLSVASAPIANVQISGSVAGKETDYEILSKKELAISARPNKYASLGASYSIKGVNDNDDIIKIGTIELTPLSNAKFAVGYKSIESGGVVTTIRDYSTVATPVGFLSLSGKLRQRELLSGELDTHALNVTMAAAGSLAFEGSYSYNPENDKGEIQSQKNTGLGIRSNIGRWGVYGGFNQKNEYLSGRTSEERKMTVDYKLDEYSAFTAGLLQSRLMDGSRTGNDTYSMGFQRKVGSMFELQLTGKYVQYLQDAGIYNKDVRAEASLSMGF